MSKIYEKYKYKFSFVMPVYNVEDYLEETVESILAQTMDFEQNCEIIFVNDGSPDNVEEICLRYKQQFPKNIKYIKQKNQGLSAARNTGIKHVEGKYVSFLDSDDKISRNTLEKTFNFFEKFYDEVDFVALPVWFFEDKVGRHPLNVDRTKSRIIDIVTEFTNIHIQVASTFVKTEILEKGFLFDPKIRRYAEDMHFLSRVILLKMAYGVIAGPKYMYRKRANGGSIVDSSWTEPEWYLSTPKVVYKYIFDYCEEEIGYIPKYIQYVVMYDIQWRLLHSKESALSPEEVKQYKSLIYALLHRIDEDVIVKQKFMPKEYKAFAINKKYGKAILGSTVKNGTKYFLNNTLLCDYAESAPTVYLETVDIKNGKLILEGFVRGVFFGGARLEFISGTKASVPSRIKMPAKEFKFLDETISDRNSFSIKLSVKPIETIQAILHDGSLRLSLNIVTSRNTAINQLSHSAYRSMNGYIVRKKPDKLVIYNATALRAFLCEFIYLLALSKRLKLGIVKTNIMLIKSDREIRDIRWLLVPMKSLIINFYTIFMRLVYFSLKPFIHKKIWLISDRVNAGGDNGEALFRYIRAQPLGDTKVYFAISKSSPDYRRIQGIGNVVNRDSMYYKALFLLSDKIISSHADDFVINPFGKSVYGLMDLLHFDYVFLQHGIIYNDLSRWLNKFNKNIKLFITSARPEYESILNNDYEYGKDVVKLTGLPRYDLLESKPQGKLIIAPTWRRSLSREADNMTGLRPYSTDFKDSEYFHFYQTLISDPKLIRVLEDHNMTCDFYLHPSFATQISDFKSNKISTVQQMPYSYNTAIAEGDVMVTDYSSVIFDFAYLKKPVIYTQFDKTEFYGGSHMFDPSYFTFDKDGFGPVAQDYESTLEEIILTVESGCEMSEKYKERVEKFFYRFDKRNSQRVYEAILAMDRIKERI